MRSVRREGHVRQADGSIRAIRTSSNRRSNDHDQLPPRILRPKMTPELREQQRVHKARRLQDEAEAKERRSNLSPAERATELRDGFRIFQQECLPQLPAAEQVEER